jgi:hypothetical protein
MDKLGFKLVLAGPRLPLAPRLFIVELLDRDVGAEARVGRETMGPNCVGRLGNVGKVRKAAKKMGAGMAAVG